MANKARHAFGNSAAVESALQAGKIDAYDILFLDGDTEPKVGWIDKNGVFRLVDNGSELSDIKTELENKVSVEEVDAKLDEVAQSTMDTAKAYADAKVEAAISEHMVKKYEITSVPKGTLVDYRESEIRIMCPKNAEWVKQSVGSNGDANTYYATFKTYVFDDSVVGYIEHLGNQVDDEILTTFSTDAYGRRYQTTWLGLAKYDENSNEWTYYGKNSTEDKYIGWDYQIDWYDADGAIVASGCVRINLSNEECHSSTKPYYVGEVKKDVETIVNEKIAEINSAYEIIEF